MNREAAIPVEEVVEDLAPKRRFRPYPEYRDSDIDWLAETPAHWTTKRLKHLCLRSALYGANESASSYVNDGIRFLRTTDISEHGELVGDGVFLEPTLVRDYELANGDLLISRSGTIGRAFLFDATQHGPCAYAGYLVRFVPNATLVPRFAFYFTKSKSFEHWLRLSVISSTIGNVNGQKYANMQILHPPVDEQWAIVTFLDRETGRIDELIAKKQRLIDLLAEKRTALISHAVTKGLNPDVPMKESGIEWFGDVPEHWRITRLGWVSMEVSDINHEMPTSAADGVAFLSAKDLLDDGTLNFSDAIKRISEDDFERLSRKSRPRRGDIIYSRIGACLGKARLVEVDERFLVSYSCCMVRVNPSVADRRFFRHLLDAEMVLTEAKMRTQGIGVPDLGLSEICRFPVPLPPIDEQREIADYLDEKETTLRSLSRRINDGLEQLREYRSALISAAVTGKINVRDGGQNLCQEAVT